MTLPPIPALMTDELFREDAQLTRCEARITTVSDTGIELDRTVFYPHGGGQAGDAGVLRLADGRVIAISDTRKGAAPGQIVHVLAPVLANALAQLGEGAGAETATVAGTAIGDVLTAGLAVGDTVIAEIDWQRRHRHMRFHTATHLLCALVPHPVDGCSITAAYARLDFHMTEPLDKDAINAGLARLVAEAHAVGHRWISEAELDANPGLVRSMSVQPPRGLGRVRVLEIDGVDLQPCGGTHVANTREIGAVVVTKIEKKSAKTRRVVLGFAEAA